MLELSEKRKPPLMQLEELDRCENYTPKSHSFHISVLYLLLLSFSIFTIFQLFQVNEQINDLEFRHNLLKNDLLSLINSQSVVIQQFLTKSQRNKREIADKIEVGTDYWWIDSEANEEGERRKERMSGGQKYESTSRYTPVFESTSVQPIQERKSRVMLTKEEKRNKKSDGGRKYQEQVLGPKDTISKEELVDKDTKLKFRVKMKKPQPQLLVKKDLIEEFDIKDEQPYLYKMAAIHFGGDTSNYSRLLHKHYEGNGRIKTPSYLYTDWRASHWVNRLKQSSKFHLHHGAVTIYEEGLYFVYAQIHYSDTHEVNGFRVYKNMESVTQCTVTATHSNKPEILSNSCYTGMAQYLHNGDKISIKDIHTGIHVILTEEKSFFGIVKLADAILE